MHVRARLWVCLGGGLQVEIIRDKIFGGAYYVLIMCQNLGNNVYSFIFI